MAPIAAFCVDRRACERAGHAIPARPGRGRPATAGVRLTSPQAHPNPAPLPGYKPSAPAQVAELVDALASGASGLTVVEVRVFSWAPVDAPLTSENL